MPFHIKGRLEEKEKPPGAWPPPPSEKNSDEIVRIKIRRKTREELKQYGVKGETYEIIIRRLMGRKEKESDIEKALLFIRHIEIHLKDLKIEGKVVCKICGKTIDEIYDESKLGEELIVK